MSRPTPIVFLWIFLFGWMSHGQSFSSDLGSVVKMYHCETKSIGVSNVEIFKQVLYDEEGKPVNSISRGFTVVFVGGTEIKIGEAEMARVTNALAKMNDWKIEVTEPDDPVGMIGEQTEALVFYSAKWWILKTYSGKVSIAKVDMVMEKENLRIAALEPDGKLMASDSNDILEVIEGVLAPPEE